MGYEKRINKDWSFTDEVHNAYAIGVYSSLGVTEVLKATREEDLENGIDYIGKYGGKVFTFQERFRKLDKNTKDSYEFTLRYERPSSISDNQKKSEFYKIKADRLLYGIINASNFENSTGFIRYCIVNLKELFRAIENQDIIIDENKDVSNKKYRPYIGSNGKPHAIIKNNDENTQSNSNFIIFDVRHLCNKLKDYNFVKEQKGYLEEVKKHKIR